MSDRPGASGALLDPPAQRGAVTPRREWLSILARAARSRRGAIGLALAGAVVLLAIIGPFVAPHSPAESVTATFAPPSGSYPLGSDTLGRDVLSRVLAGGWLLLAMAAGATALGVGVGVLIGIAAAYYGKLVDGLLMRIVDVFLAIPQLVFALLLVSVLGPHVWLILVAVGMSHAPQVARVVRAAALDISDRDYVRAVELLGTPPRRVMAGEILPNVLSVVMVELGLRFTYSILIIAGLSFLGFGIQPPAANWGLMINENRIGLVANPWGVVAPILLIAILSIGLNTFTDAIVRASLGVDRPTEQLAVTAAMTTEVGSGLGEVIS
jgi:peptide/nickel transport system permease protein